VGRERALTALLPLPWRAELTHPFGHRDAAFKVAAKGVRRRRPGEVPGVVTLTCDPDYGVALVARHD
jgi:hypothetical protein